MLATWRRKLDEEVRGRKGRLLYCARDVEHGVAVEVGYRSIHLARGAGVLLPVQVLERVACVVDGCVRG